MSLVYAVNYYDGYPSIQPIAPRRSLTLISAPSKTPISIAEAKDHLRIDHNDDDFMLELYIQAATSHIDGKDGILQRAIMPQTWELTSDGFLCGGIELPLPPLISVESVKYLDANGDEQTIDVDDYVVDVGASPSRVALADANASWPVVKTINNAVRIRFRAGYVGGVREPGESEGELAANVPPAIKAALLMMVADWYEHRETVVTGTSSAAIQMAAPAKALLAPYRMMVFG